MLIYVRHDAHDSSWPRTAAASGSSAPRTGGVRSGLHSVESGWTPRTTISSGAPPRSCSAAIRSANPSWWTEGFPGKAAKRRAFEAYQRAGSFADVDGVDHQQAAQAGDARKQIETVRASIQELDAGGNARVLGKAIDQMYSHAVVGMDQVAQPQNQSAFAGLV